MRKREVIELRYRIDCVGRFRSVANKEQSLSETVKTRRSPRAWHT